VSVSSDVEREHIEQIKDAAERLAFLIRIDTKGYKDGEQARQIALAMTNLEQAVVWAVKAYT
jgi:hypothetical protein